MEVEAVYQVDHSQLPPDDQRFSAQLAYIKAVMVTMVSPTEVTIAFPSKHSLDTFFASGDDNKPPKNHLGRLLQPNFDQVYHITPDLARTLLPTRIPFEQFAARRGTKSFWVNHITTTSTGDVAAAADGGIVNNRSFDNAPRENDTIDLQHDLPNWGWRKRATFVGKHRSDNIIKEEEPVGGGEGSGSRKRKKRCESVNYQIIKPKKMKKENRNQKQRKNVPLEVAHDDDLPPPDPKLRWTTERYKLAEQNILKIMKAKQAVYGNPVLRADLRTEARKLIGDTGLLDHLLKHMAGKLAPGGKERFRRRHNPEGAMEYWLESAQLLDLRKQAGIADPYWNPPDGWKPGDPTSQDPACARELKRLRNDFDKLKSEFEEIASNSQASSSTKDLIQGPQECSEDFEKLGKDLLNSLKAKQGELLKRKAQIEEQLLHVSKALNVMEEDLHRVVVVEEANGSINNNSCSNNGNIIRVEPFSPESGVAINEPASADHKYKHKVYCKRVKDKKKTERGQRPKSAFRICKPEGTFLHPADMASGPFSNSQVVPPNLLFASPSSSPLSVGSSKSSAPYPFCHHQPPASSLIKPMALRPITITGGKSDQALQEENGLLIKAKNRDDYIAHVLGRITGRVAAGPSRSSPSPTASSANSSISVLVPDLNQIPQDATYHVHAIPRQQQQQQLPTPNLSSSSLCFNPTSSIIERRLGRNLQGSCSFIPVKHLSCSKQPPLILISTNPASENLAVEVELLSPPPVATPHSITED